MQIENSHRLELPARLRHKLESYRRRVWLVKLAEGILAGLFGLLLSYLLVFVLDRVADTSAAVRLFLLLAGVTCGALWLPLKWHRWVWKTRQLEQAARLVRHAFPRIGDQLLGIVELAHSEMEQERSESLCRAAMRQVDDEVRDFDFQGAVPHPRHRQWGWAAGSMLLLSAMVLLVVPAAGTNALARWLFPWRSTERYTFAQLQHLPAQLVVPYAEPFLVQARLSDATVWSPSQGRAKYGGQAPIDTSLNESSGYQFSVPPQKEPDHLLISVGDARKRIHIDPTTRPELTEITARIELPAYLQYATVPVQDVRSGSVSVVRGSRVELSGTATRSLAEAFLGDQPVTTRELRFHVPPREIQESCELSLRWRDQVGLHGKTPLRLTVTALDDEAPTLHCLHVEREQVVLSTDTITFDAEAQDDFGVQLVGMQWEGIADPLRNPHPASGEQLVAVGGPEARQLPVRLAFSTERLGIPPQSLRVKLFATDFFPGRARAYSTEYVFHVLSPEEHAIWLTQQLRKWLRQANEVYEREQQLHEANKALRALPAEELDQPDIRRRIVQQASAEDANARRLSAVTHAGEELIERAMQNDQFNVATLENWAEMLNVLQDIAGQRMPSVAELLTQAAEAPGSKPQAAPSSTPENAKSPPQVGVNRDPRALAGEKTAPSPPSDVPAISDVESGFNELVPEEDKSKEESQKSNSKPSLRLPTTDIVGGASPQQQDQASSPAAEKMEEVLTEQADLLAAFAQVADELKKILADLEGSTFVKRLKAASRRQLAVAKELNDGLASEFGVDSPRLEPAQREQLAALGEREVAYGDELYVVQEDLEAYFNRVQEGKFLTVLNEMKSARVVGQLQEIGRALDENLGGQSIAEAEFWADTLDRWAEQLVGPG